MRFEITVIIPTCNQRFDSLKDAVQSVSNQGLDEVEIVIVDDNKLDCVELISQMFFNFKNVRVVRNSSSHGAASARNLGASVAKGKYITFLDDDDLYLPGRLKTMIAHFNDDNYVFVSSGRFVQTDDFSKLELIEQRFGLIQLHDIIFGNEIDIGFMILRERFNEMGGFDVNLKSLEDWDFLIRCLQLGPAFKQKRFDYIVNRSIDLQRVSNREATGYEDLECKWRDKFGSRWSAFMICSSLRLSKNFTFIKSCYLALKHKTLLPVKSFISHVVKYNA